MNKSIKILIGLFVLCFIMAVPIYAQTPSDIREININIDTVIASGFTQPVQVIHAGDNSQRLFVVEQTGLIKIIHPDRSITTFLNIDPRVLSGGERGLLGLAFHPQYAANGYFYLDYTDNDGNTTISRFQVSSNPNIVNENSEQVLFKINQPYSNHNGGQLLFGPDGYLYIGMGDGGSGGDPQNNAQNLSTPLGKMLRIDVDQGSLYAIPPSNPYINTPGADPRIWAWGLRNPWRFSFDRLTGDLYIGDVGQNNWEEIDFLPNGTPGGTNFGWRCMEGTHTYNTDPPCDSPSYLATLTAPITEYDHTVGRSITGGFVYRGSLNPGLQGIYFFADYVNGIIFSLQNNNGSWVQTVELAPGFLISAFGEDENGELYVADYSGSIRQLTGASLSPPNLDQSTISVDKQQANPDEVLTFTINITNSGSVLNSTATLINPIPEKLIYLPGTMTATSGTINDTQPTQLTWSGSIGQQSTVTIQYQARIKTDADGSVVNLITISGSEFSTVQDHSVTSVPRPVFNSTPNDFILPGTQPLLEESLIDSVDCQTCHSPPIYNLWRGSMMSQAGRDPLTWAAIYNANAYVPNSGEYCLRCHTPNGWYGGRSNPSDGSTLTSQDIRNGVSCQLCHRMVDVIASASDEASTIDAQVRSDLENTPPTDHRGSAMIIIDQLDRRRGPFNLANDFPYHTAYQTDFLGQRMNAWKEASLCGSCHNVDNPLLSWDTGRNQYWPNAMDAPASDFSKGALFPIERTFDEWAASDFADQGVVSASFGYGLPDQTVRSCQDCHMPRTSGYAAQSAFNPPYRNCQNGECIGEHSFFGANSWVPQLLLNPNWRLSALSDENVLNNTITGANNFVKKSALVNVTVLEGIGNKTARVTVTNLTGHKLPTGYPEGRRIWINIVAKDQAGNILYESGKYDWNNHTLIEDADIKIYEAKQGITEELSQSIGLTSGPTFHFILNNTIIKDNRIPPKGITQAEYAAIGLNPVGTVYEDNQNWDVTEYALPADTESVTVRLYYQVASKDYIDFLENYGGHDGAVLKSLWEETPADPILMNIVFSPQFDSRLPIIFKN
jgi:uncharacterized repeat protein (TIGR01451 family)